MPFQENEDQGGRLQDKHIKISQYADGTPSTFFCVEDVQAEYERLRAAGVRFTRLPTHLGPVTITVFDDTCGNLIQINQRH